MRQMRPSLLPVALSGVLLVGMAACDSADEPGASATSSSAEPTPTTTSTGGDTTTTVEPDEGPPPVPRVAGTITTGLTSPWGLDFLPDGDALVTERDPALIKLVTPEGRVTTVGEVPGVDSELSSEGGLLGLALHPDFEAQPWVYVYFTTSEDNRVARMRYQDGELGPVQVVLDGIPVGDYHNGGRIAFGPDGMLYVTTGDANLPGNLAQDPDSLGGKILRLTPGGEPAPDNPDPGSPVLSLGHRNPQGIAWDDDDRLWAAEFGQNTWDELNLIEPGGNYGWPLCEGRCDNDTFIDPLAQWGTDEASPSGIAYLDGAVWMAGLGGERLWRIDVDGDRVVGDPTAFFGGEYGRVRTLEVAPDGSLWMTTSNTDGRGDPRPDDDRILVLALD